MSACGKIGKKGEGIFIESFVLVERSVDINDLLVTNSDDESQEQKFTRNVISSVYA
jgi:hypothetical protein